MTIHTKNVLRFMLLFSIIFILCGVLVVSKRNMQNSKAIELGNQRISDLNSNIQDLLELEHLKVKYEDVVISSIIVMDMNEKKNNLIDLVKDSLLIILRKPKFSCDDCFSSIIENNRAVINSFSNFIILFSSESLSDIQAIMKLHDLKDFPIYYTSNDLILELDRGSSNYFVCINEILNIESVFFPRKDNVIVQRKYLERLTTR